VCQVPESLRRRLSDFNTFFIRNGYPTLIDFVLSLSWQDREMGMDVACGNRVRTSDERFRRLQHQAEPKDLIPTGRTPQHTRKLTRCLCWMQLLLME
jgi:hypothetical protein